MATPMASPYPGTAFGWGPFVPSNREVSMMAVREIRKGIHYYRVYLILAIITGLVTAGVTVASGTPQFLGSSVPSSIWNGNNTSANPAPFGSATAGVALLLLAVTGTVGLAGFILILIAWLSWRGGVRQLRSASGEYGVAHANSARAAEQDYGRTVLTFILGVVTSVVLVAAIIFISVSAAFGTIHPGAPSSGPSNATLAQLRLEVFLAIVIFGSVAALFQFFQYYFASRSFQGAIGALANLQQQARLESGRTLILWGGALAIVSILPAFYLGFAFLSVIPTILLLFGFSRVVGVYDDWLSHPVRPSAATVLR